MKAPKMSSMAQSISVMKMSDTEVNPIWARYCSQQMEDWLTWLRNIHIRSYIELCERFIDLHPYYTPNTHDLGESLPLYERLLIGKPFLDNMTDIGVRVWANTTLVDFVNALYPYSQEFPEVREVRKFFIKHLNWLDRLYRFGRADLIAQLREEGRDI